MKRKLDSIIDNSSKKLKVSNFKEEINMQAKYFKVCSIHTYTNPPPGGALPPPRTYRINTTILSSNQHPPYLYQASTNTSPLLPPTNHQHPQTPNMPPYPPQPPPH